MATLIHIIKGEAVDYFDVTEDGFTLGRLDQNYIQIVRFKKNYSVNYFKAILSFKQTIGEGCQFQRYKNHWHTFKP